MEVAAVVRGGAHCICGFDNVSAMRYSSSQQDISDKPIVYRQIAEVAMNYSTSCRLSSLI